MEGIPDRRKRHLLRGGVESGLGGSLTQGTRKRTQKGAGGYSREAARTKVRETEGKSGRRQGCQRLGCIGHRGKKTPTLVNEVGDGFGARCSTESETVFDTIRRSGPDVVKRPFPRSCCAET
jgi:hypothetical protein